jgi:hypothetical protein
VLWSKAKRLEGGWNAEFHHRKVALLRTVLGADPGRGHGPTVPVFAAAPNPAG